MATIDCSAMAAMLLSHYGYNQQTGPQDMVGYMFCVAMWLTIFR